MKSFMHIIDTCACPYRIAAIENVNTIDERRLKIALETELSITICRPIGDKWQSKTLSLAFYDRRLAIVKRVFDCRISGGHPQKWRTYLPGDCIDIPISMAVRNNGPV